MTAGFDAGQLVHVVIAVSLAECAVLVVLRTLAGRGAPLRDVLWNMGSGLCLMLALRALVLGHGTPWVAAWLLAAGALHATDLALRWPRSAGHAHVAASKGIA